ncbi:MAG: SDR family NAD(P)-dependent oxidoreductase [Syntrophomonadaceae bacterium]|jgi:3-oxoacyl-[acyl-carrier protein] reductase|nr:SDR family NAD(P)-dependent oxidoreductase [Syntrophomonadaceae bacterium]
MLLEGKKVIITGGVTGIGKATVLAMAKEGASVVTFTPDLPDSERAVATIEGAKKLGSGVFSHIQCDVRNEAAVNTAVEQAVKLMGGLTTVVNCAGIETQKPAENITPDDMYAEFAVHYVGTALICAAAFPYMKETGGSLINYSSYAGTEGTPGMCAYSAAKAALLGYSRVIAKEWGKYYIRVNMPCPAAWTEMGKEWYETKTPEGKKEADAWLQSIIPLGGTFGEAEDAANLNVFLASDMSKFITGQIIPVDGGMFFVR